MKILVFCTANLSHGTGSAVRARLIVEGLRHHGADVCVVSSGVPERFTKIGVHSALFAEYKDWESTISEATASFRPDILYGITEAGADAVMNVARKYDLPFILDLHGLGVVEILELGAGYGSRLTRIKNSLRWLSRAANAHALTIANPTLLPYAKRINRNSIPIFGMSDVSHFSPEGLVARLGRDSDRVQVLYAGNYFKWQGIDLLVDAITILSKKNAPIEFTLMGSVGQSEILLHKWNKKLPKDTVNFVASVDYNEVADYYRAADVCVIPRPFMLSTYLAFPQKLVDYMAAGRAIVATDIAPHRWALKSPRAGVLCRATPNSLADALCQATDEQLREEISVNAREVAVHKFCHLKQTEKIYSLCSKIVRGN